MVTTGRTLIDGLHMVYDIVMLRLMCVEMTSDSACDYCDCYFFQISCPDVRTEIFDLNQVTFNNVNDMTLVSINSDQ